VTWENGPATGDLLQSVPIAAGFLGPVEFKAAAVRDYLTAERAGDGVASFLLVLSGGSGELGFGGNLLFENREGGHDGVNGNEPFITLSPVTTVTPTVTPSPSATAAAMTTTPTATVTTAATAETPTVTVTVTAMTATPTATTTGTVTPSAPATNTPTATATANQSVTPVATATPGLFLPLITK
jgi:hypothetical protein